MIRTLVFATLAAIGSMYLPAAPELDRSEPVEAVATTTAHTEQEAIDGAWEAVQEGLDTRCAERARDGGSVSVAAEHVQWVPGGFQAEVAAVGWCRF